MAEAWTVIKRKRGAGPSKGMAVAFNGKPSMIVP